MNKLLEQLSKPLTIDQIDFRVQSINKGGYATILAYKDARVDMNRLNEVVGPLGWKRHHTRENHNCVVSIWDKDNKHWVSKEDTGTESQSESEKGLASDSFKRACFNWGIGLELYDYPLIQVKLKQDEFKVDGQRAKATWQLQLNKWVWQSEFQFGKLIHLEAADQNGEMRFRWSGGLPDIWGQTTGELLDGSKLIEAYRFFKSEMDDEEQDDFDYKKIQRAAERLSSDEMIEVSNLFGDQKPKGSRRGYKAILKAILAQPLDQDGKPLVDQDETDCDV